MISDPAEGPSDVEQTYPLWEPTDWTPRQRTAAICALVLLALTYGLLAVTSAHWGTAPLAQNALIPIGLTLLCPGTTLLTYVYWYAYKHGHNSVGDHASSAMTAYVMLVLAGLVALVTLALQLVGATLGAMAGWSYWLYYGSISYLAPVAVCLLISVFLTLGERILPWRPTRDAAAPGSALGAPVTGARLGLRWVVMLLAQNPWVLLGAPLYALEALSAPLPPTETSIVLGAASVFFLVAALAELTHAARVITPAPRAP